MARLDMSGMDEVIEQMKNMQMLSSKVADKMLLAGAEVMKKSWQQTISRFGLIDTGDMLKSVGYPRKPKDVNDARTIDVYPQGKDRDGVRNAEKAFILHYGRSNMDPTEFVDFAEEQAEAECDAAMKRIWDNFIENGG